jgi:hypothetical protein
LVLSGIDGAPAPLRPTTELRRLRVSACRRFSRLRVNSSAAAASGVDSTRQRVAAFVAMEAANAWANFSRSYFLSCAINARLERGIRVNPLTPVNSSNAALGMSVRYYKPYAAPKADGTWHRRDEPTWHDPNVLTTLLNVLNVTHMVDVYAAFSINSRVFLDLPVFRNFFAHRNQGSSAAAQRLAPQYSIPIDLRPAEILLERALGRPFPVVVDWLDDLTLVSEYLCL